MKVWRNRMEIITDSVGKALAINLNESIYGSFAEIGAGQEVARFFFQAGGASKTIAKAMSAYDMKFSDTIYGKEASGRYVCESRLVKMLSKEYGLLEKRLGDTKGKHCKFFVTANTVATSSPGSNREGHGLMGTRFQLEPGAPFNDIYMHVRMLDTDPVRQQEALGVLGTNLTYACFTYFDNPDMFIKSLHDNIENDRIDIDMLKVEGEGVSALETEITSLLLVKYGLTDAVIITPDGNVVWPSELFYKKDIFILRGSFRPPTLVNTDMFETGLKKFQKDFKLDRKNIVALNEITMQNLSLVQDGEISDRDFASRVEVLKSLNHKILVSNYFEYYRLARFMRRYSSQNLGIVVGIDTLLQVFNEVYYDKLPGGLLEALGIIQRQNVNFYVYPSLDKEDKKKVITTKNFPVDGERSLLFQSFQSKLNDIPDANLELLNIYSTQVLKMIQEGKKGWEKMVIPEVAKIIKEKSLFK